MKIYTVKSKGKLMRCYEASLENEARASLVEGETMDSWDVESVETGGKSDVFFSDGTVLRGATLIKTEEGTQETPE